MANPLSSVDGIGYDGDVTTGNRNAGWIAGRKPVSLGQTVNTVASTVADQMTGTVALPALAAAATGTVTITNALITANSMIFTQVRRGTTTGAAGAGVVTEAQAPTAGSCVISVRNPGSAASLSTDYELWYWIVN